MVLRTSCCLQIITAYTLLASDYYVTYSLSSKQLLVSSENQVISKAIVPFQIPPILYSATLENENPVSKSESEFIKEHKEQIIHELMNYEVKVKSNQASYALSLSEKTELKVGPIPVRIEFNDDFVNIKVPQER